jgi:hypothetical protein
MFLIFCLILTYRRYIHINFLKIKSYIKSQYFFASRLKEDPDQDTDQKLNN